jgi:hypothetical protein
MQTMDSMLTPQYWRDINPANVSPADPHKRTLKSKINVPYPPDLNQARNTLHVVYITMLLQVPLLQ